MMRTLLVALCGLAVINSPAVSQDQPVTRPVDAATAAAARRLLAATGATKLVLSTMESMIASQREANPQIPAVFWDAFMAHARRDTTRLIDLLVPIYASHLTQSELEELLRFYQSPIGQRLTAVQAAIAQESQLAGQNWGELIARIVGDSLAQAEGNLPPNR